MPFCLQFAFAWSIYLVLGVGRGGLGEAQGISTHCPGDAEGAQGAAGAQRWGKGGHLGERLKGHG